MFDPVKIFTLLWLLGLTIYVGFEEKANIRQWNEVGERFRSLEETADARSAMSGLNQSPPKTGGFKILHAPNGKWRLFRGDYWIADYDNHDDAVYGMKLCINPEIQRYDDAGTLIDRS